MVSNGRQWSPIAPPPQKQKRPARVCAGRENGGRCLLIFCACVTARGSEKEVKIHIKSKPSGCVAPSSRPVGHPSPSGRGERDEGWPTANEGQANPSRFYPLPSAATFRQLHRFTQIKCRGLNLCPSVSSVDKQTNLPSPCPPRPPWYYFPQPFSA